MKMKNLLNKSSTSNQNGLNSFKTKRKLSELKDSTYQNIFFMIFIPIVVILLIFSLILILSYTRERKSLLKESYSYRLDLIYRNNERSIDSIIQTVHMLDKSPEFVKTAVGSAFPSENDIESMQKSLGQVAASNSIIHSIAFVDRQNKVVITDSQYCSLSSFFYEKFSYENYDENFWKYYQAPLSTVRALSPTFVNINSGEAAQTSGIIPIVFTGIGNTKISNLIILNIDITKILYNELHQLTKNSKFFIINRQTLQRFDENSTKNQVIDAQFYKNISEHQYSVFDRKNNNGKKEFIVSYYPKNSILGYCYAVSVPYSDINQSGYLYLFLVMASLIFFISFSLIVSHLGAKKIYMPITEIAGMFKSGAKNNAKNTFDFIESSILETLNANSLLTQEVAVTLPAYKERILIDILNSNEYYRIDNVESLEATLDFKYNYFCSVIIQLIPTDEFNKEYSSIEYNRIKSGIFKIVEIYFSQKYITNVIPNDTNVLYVLLNLKTIEPKENILSIIESLEALLKEDTNLIRLNVGIGSVSEGLMGLRESHKEAMRSISPASNLRYVVLNLNNSKKGAGHSYYFTITDEENLHNFLLAGKKDQALAYVNQIYDNNIHISDFSLIHLNMQIINTIFKVMGLKSIPYDDEKKGDIAIISDIVAMPQYQIRDTINELVEKISTYILTTNDTQFSTTIVEFMQANYHDEHLCLDSIAAVTGIPAKQVSRMFKEQFGVNFVDYLAQIRINKAKEYLKTTNKTIAEILTLTGFNNRNTFLRTFKKITGLSPSEYKKHLK